MPWLSIIAFVLSFLVSKKSGMSTGAALLTGAVVGGGTYYAVDSANPNNLFQIGVSTQAGTGAEPADAVPTNSNPKSGTSVSNAGGLAGQTVSTIGSVLKSWGPTGTALVAGTVGAVSGDSSKLLLYGGIAVAAFLILKD